MALLLVVKRMFPTPRFHRFFSSSTDAKSPHFSMVDYLVSTFGFSPDKAARVSKSVAHVTTPQKPDAVHRFLDCHGFTEAQIRTIITGCPKILCSSPENTLNTNLLNLRNIGLSSSALTQLILSNPQALQAAPFMPRIKFWRRFFGGDETALVKAFKQNRNLANYDIDQTISPNLSLLRNQGFSIDYIHKIVLQVPMFITRRISLAEDRILRAKELGFQPGSGMFLVALDAMRVATRDLHKKMDIFISYGSSQGEFLSAMQKSPAFLKLSEKNLHEKMDFLTGEAGCLTSYIACFPNLLGYSLEKRLRPRLCVLYILESKGLSVRRRGLYTVSAMTDNKFVENYILPFKEEISGLHEDYLAACT